MWGGTTGWIGALSSPKESEAGYLRYGGGRGESLQSWKKGEGWCPLWVLSEEKGKAGTSSAGEAWIGGQLLYSTGSYQFMKGKGR